MITSSWIFSFYISFSILVLVLWPQLSIYHWTEFCLVDTECVHILSIFATHWITSISHQIIKVIYQETLNSIINSVCDYGFTKIVLKWTFYKIWRHKHVLILTIFFFCKDQRISYPSVFLFKKWILGDNCLLIPFPHLNVKRIALLGNNIKHENLENN